jgi:predicted site-specific integrase-resolvase
MSLEKLMTAKDITEVFGIELQRVYELTRRKLLPCVVLGERQYRYSRQAIERFIADGGNQEGERENNGGLNA